MERCLELAAIGAGSVAPNPMVGAVLVHQGRIIGEGFHRKYGEAHAEINCLQSVREEDRQHIPASVMYVSLEPCAHHGKTPPCADRIILEKIPHVVIGCRDPFKEVDGRGIAKLNAAGIRTTVGILEKECIDLNRRFFTYYKQHRPYVILKWAESGNQKIAKSDYSRVFISNELSNRLVHQWRNEEASILIGTNTAYFDNPSLTVRGRESNHPVRMIVDMGLRLPSKLQIFDRQSPTIIFNSIRHEESANLLYYQVTEDVELVHQLVHALYQLKIQSVFVEGGSRLIQSFIDAGIWDEARIITNEAMLISEGIPAPELFTGELRSEIHLDADRIKIYNNPIKA